MKLNHFLISFFFTCLTNIGHAQQWSVEQLKKANTAEFATYMTQTERDVIKYINLARLYPLDYLKIEVLVNINSKNSYFNDADSFYVNSLIKHLKSMAPTHVLMPDKYLFDGAKCFAKESGEKGILGHNRVDCKDYSFSAECCHYGASVASEIVLWWMIDEGVPSLGHRITCLSGDYKSIGVSMHPHIEWRICTVADFSRK
jgi:hypothetical protein